MSPYDTTNLKEQLRNYTAYIISLDLPFYNYHLTRWEGDGGDDIFGTSGVNVRGNINGGLGLFLGLSSSGKKIDIK